MYLVSVNCGAASPGVSGERTSEGMTSWAQHAIDGASRPAVVCAQETSAAWRDLWARAGYTVHTSAPVYRPVSAVIVDDAQLGASSTVELETAPYHGSYLAAAEVELPEVGPATVASVHASPNVVDPRYVMKWPRSVPMPQPRNGGGSYAADALFDSDMVLATLARLASEGPSLAAGDLNEARGWDELPAHIGESWGERYFAGVGEAGWVDVTHREWGHERPTRRVPTGPSLQLDHILATPTVASLLRDAFLDPTWEKVAMSGRGRSDHRPIWVAFG